MAVVNKDFIINEIAEKQKTTKADAKRFLEALEDTILEQVSEGNDVNISGLVKFSVEHRAARTMKNPRTGEDVEVAEKRVVKVRPMARLRKAAAEEDAE